MQDEIKKLNTLIRKKFKFNYIAWKYKLFSTNVIELTFLGMGRRNLSLITRKGILGYSGLMIYPGRRFSITTVQGSNDNIVSITLPDVDILTSKEGLEEEDLTVKIDFNTRAEAKRFIMGLALKLQAVADEASYLPKARTNCIIVYNKLTNN